MLGLSLLDFKQSKQGHESTTSQGQDGTNLPRLPWSEADLDVDDACMPLWGTSVSGLQKSELQDEQGIMHERSWGPDPVETCAMQLEPVISFYTLHRVAIFFPGAEIFR